MCEAFGVLRPGAALVLTTWQVAVGNTKAEKAAPGRSTPYTVTPLSYLVLSTLMLHTRHLCILHPKANGLWVRCHCAV